MTLLFVCVSHGQCMVGMNDSARNHVDIDDGEQLM